MCIKLVGMFDDLQIITAIKMLKSAKELASLPPDSEDIFCSNAVQRYSSRDKDLEDVNLIDFVSERLTTRRTKVILYYPYDKDSQKEDFCRVHLLLYVPWRKEDELKGDFESYTDRYLTFENQINECRSHYHKIDNHIL